MGAHVAPIEIISHEIIREQNVVVGEEETRDATSGERRSHFATERAAAN